MLVVTALPFALLLPQPRQSENMRQFQSYMMLFCAYAAVVSIGWTFALMDPSLAIPATYYAFNFCLMIVCLRLGMLHPRATLLTIAYAISVSAAVQAVSLALTTNAAQLRVYSLVQQSKPARLLVAAVALHLLEHRQQDEDQVVHPGANLRLPPLRDGRIAFQIRHALRRIAMCAPFREKAETALHRAARSGSGLSRPGEHDDARAHQLPLAGHRAAARR